MRAPTKLVVPPTEAATSQEDTVPQEDKRRAAWQALGYEKLTAADVQTRFSTTGAESLSHYS